MDATYGLLWAIPRIAWLGFFALMLAWIVYSQNGFAYNNTKLGSQGYLNHHYIFMTVAWPICMFEAIFSYRAPIYVLPHSNAFKYLHIALQTAAGIFILMGLIFVGLFKRYNGEAQFFSIHSWLGAIATAMYIAQYTAGFWAYLVSRWSPERKAAFYSVHRFLGGACLLTAFAAIIAAMAEVQTFDVFAHYGIKGFYGPPAYSFLSMAAPVMGLLILIQAVVIVYNLVHSQQALPANRAAPAVNGAHTGKATV